MLIPEACWLGRLEYGAALARQHAERAAVLDGRSAGALWLLEHDPVVTTGRRNAAVDEDALRGQGVAVFHTDRGGLATWHGPGQLVAYVILDLSAHRIKVREFVAALEDTAIAWLAEQGVIADRREGYRGVWVNRDKICAVGVHIRRGVSTHGLALNLTPDLSGFGLITPCGITDGGVTSLARHRSNAPSSAEAAVSFGCVLRAQLTLLAASIRPQTHG